MTLCCPTKQLLAFLLRLFWILHAHLIMHFPLGSKWLLDFPPKVWPPFSGPFILVFCSWYASEFFLRLFSLSIWHMSRWLHLFSLLQLLFIADNFQIYISILDMCREVQKHDTWMSCLLSKLRILKTEPSHPSSMNGIIHHPISTTLSIPLLKIVSLVSLVSPFISTHLRPYLGHHNIMCGFSCS